jgi:hypothetical protein
MPQPNDNNGGQGDDAAKAAAAKAVADAAAANGSGNGAGDGEEMITIKKADLKKIEEDRDNYRRMGLQKKADEKNLHSEIIPAGNGAAVPPVIDEKKINDTAVAAVNKTLRDASEKSAKRMFLKDNPEYADDAQWNAMVANLTFRGNEVTTEDVLDRMEAALLEHKRSTGKLSEYMQQQAERTRTRARYEGMMDAGRSGGGAGDRNQGDGGSGLTPAGENMARNLHRDPAKVAKIDYARDREIKP